MGFLDRAIKKAEQALADLQAKKEALRPSTPADGPPPAVDAKFGTPYREGMLGRPGWRERGMADPAAVLPVAARDRAGIPHSTKSEIRAEPYGVGRRWTSGERSAGLFYRLDPDHRAFTASAAEDGRSLVVVGDVVLETNGLDEETVAGLASAVRRATAES